MDRSAFSLHYRECLGAYLARPDEGLRQRAYELGRQAVDGQMGLMELAQLHAMAAGALEAADPRQGVLLLASEFFAEAVAPFEMELRGYREALERNEALLLQAQKVEALGLLVGGIVHDFSNVLTIIRGYTELALEDPALQFSPNLRRVLQEVNEAADRAAGLARNLLAFSRNQAVEPLSLDLNAVMADTVKMLSRVLGRDVELELHPSAELWRIKADPHQIGQILMNLALNARDAMPDGGRITLTTANEFLAKIGPAAPHGLVPGNYAVLSVTDTGTGMDSATQARIFEPFFSTKAPGRGTGLGLATVYSIVKKNRGGLQVESSLGHGTCFKVYLPKEGEP